MGEDGDVRWRLGRLPKQKTYPCRPIFGLCAEFPSLSWLANNPEDTLLGIRQVIADVVTDLLANNEPVPEPIAVRHYSGKFLIRIPPEIHRRLVLEAAEAGVSLNRLASARLANG